MGEVELVTGGVVTKFGTIDAEGVDGAGDIHPFLVGRRDPFEVGDSLRVVALAEEMGADNIVPVIVAGVAAGSTQIVRPSGA